MGGDGPSRHGNHRPLPRLSAIGGDPHTVLTDVRFGWADIAVAITINCVARYFRIAKNARAVVDPDDDVLWIQGIDGNGDFLLRAPCLRGVDVHAGNPSEPRHDHDVCG